MSKTKRVHELVQQQMTQPGRNDSPALGGELDDDFIRQLAATKKGVSDSSEIMRYADGSIRIAGIRLYRVGLIVESDIDERDWLGVLEGVQKIKRAYQWMLADLLRYGLERRYGETAEQVEGIADITGYSTSTLNDLAWLSGRVEISCRQENLSLEHHKKVASLPPDQQNAWLNYAVEHGLSVSDLAAAIQGIEVVDPTPLDKFEKRWKPFKKSQIRLAKTANTGQRVQMVNYLRQLADEIEDMNQT